MTYRQLALTALALKAQSDKAEALASLTILLDHPAGIGDHSTVDLYRNLNEALNQLSDAEDRISVLAKYFPELKDINIG
jgi:hypothetical protein